ncbi:hypothetical protein [uncultured Alistipes sp.]|uniref:hypothetical protein n=1 Tax=uncultured Alistipes sp. TaxID=538949 RepID=UPI00261569AA|nr:hypothetical protein [uncultured Alistipes sp.]
MNLLRKNTDWWREKGGWIIALIIALLCYFMIHPRLERFLPLIKEFPAIGMCAFGFLLTLLGIIIQSNTEIIAWLKSDKQLYNRFIKLNRRVVIISFIVSLLSYVIGYTEWPDLIQNDNLNLATISTWLGLLSWFILDVIYFLRIFYLLVQRTDKK